MGNAGALEGNLDEVLLCILNTLADRVGNFGGLAQTEANGALAVAYDYESRKLEDTTALNSLGYAIESDDGFLELVLSLLVTIKLTTEETRA